MEARQPFDNVSGVLHTLVASGGTGGDQVGFWLEALASTPAPLASRRRPGRLSTVPHPHAGTPDEVARAVAALLPDLSAWLELPGPLGQVPVVRTTATVLYLPSDGPTPRPSPTALAAGAAPAVVAGPPRLRPWSTSVLWVPLDRLTAPLWRALSGDAPAAPFGSGVEWLAALGRLAGAYWLRGAVVPRVDSGRMGASAAYWLPLLDDAELRPQLEALAQAMPVSLLAAVRPSVWAGQLEAHRWECTSDLLSAMVDGLARYTPMRGGGPRRPPAARAYSRRIKRQTSAWGEIARTLGAASPLLYASSSDPLHKVAARLLAWQDSVGGREARVGRLALRLVPADGDKGKTDSLAAAGATGWRLELAVASLGDRRRTSSLSAVLAGGERGRRAAAALGLTATELETVTRSDLRRVAALVPDLAARLGEATARGSLDLSPQEALRFLQEDGPRLRQAGFPVTVPAWWRESARRRLRLDIATTPASSGPGRGRLGVTAIANVSWRARVGDADVAAADLLRAVRAGGGVVTTADGWVEVSARDVRVLARLLKAAPDSAGAIDQRALLDLFAELEEEGEENEAEVSVDAQGWLHEALDSMRAGMPIPSSLPMPELGPDDLHGDLRPYQADGVRWLWSLSGRGMGACLADDMGLGKTVQAIALVAARRRAGLCGPNPLAAAGDEADRGAAGPAADDRLPVLLVCPTSVLTNWAREFARFAPQLRIGVRHGASRRRGEGAAPEMAAYDVVLTSYALVWRDLRVLSRVAWDGVILDEAQAIKNPATRASRAVRRLGARYRLALTGTPIENRLQDLWAIFQFLNPGYLGSAEAFRRRFGQPVEEHGDERAAKVLHRLVAPFILRRLKSDPNILQDLPEKIELRELCTLTREQVRLYQAVVDRMLGDVRGLDGLARRGAVATAILRLKQILNHPSQFLRDHEPFRPERSGKVVRVHQIVEEALAEGDRLLLFTQFVAFGDLLRPYLEALVGEEVPFVHGGLERSARDRAVTRFQSPDGPPLMLLSLKAGGVGLNLTRANRVVHLDRWWNPAVESQATDRAHRIGQTERVMVHKMVVTGTVEERIDALMDDKRRLAEQVVGRGEGWITSLDDDALADLVRLREGEVGEV